MQRVLVSNLMMIKEQPRFDAMLKERGYVPVWAEVDQYLDEAACLSAVGSIDGWLAGDDQITRAVITAALPRLKVIAKWGTGIDSIDLDAARELGVPVYNAPGAFATAVAEVAIGYMLSLARHIVATDRAVRAGDWPKWQGRELTGGTIGVIGYGAIGQRIGTLASAFGMTVLHHDPFLKAEPAVGTAASLDDLAAQSDFVCLACALSDDNRHLVNKAFLARMQESAYLINVARGPLVDEAALIDALKARRLAGCALDVFEEEPIKRDHALLSMPGVILGSHNANNGRQAVEAVHGITLANLDKGLKG